MTLSGPQIGNGHHEGQLKPGSNVDRAGNPTIEDVFDEKCQGNACRQTERGEPHDEFHGHGIDRSHRGGRALHDADVGDLAWIESFIHPGLLKAALVVAVFLLLHLPAAHEALQLEPQR